MSITSYITSKTGKRILCTIGITILLAPYITVGILYTKIWVDRVHADYLLQECNGVEHITQKDLDLLRRIQLLLTKETK